MSIFANVLSTKPHIYMGISGMWYFWYEYLGTIK